MKKAKTDFYPPSTKKKKQKRKEKNKLSNKLSNYDFPDGR